MKIFFVILTIASLTVSAADLRIVEAAKSGDCAAVRSLIRQKVNINAAEGDGTSALHWAAFNDDVDCARVLINAQADVRARVRDGGATPLYMAALNGDAALLDVLLAAGADPNAALDNGTTALMTAAASGSVDAVKILLDRGANVNARENARGETALVFAAGENRGAVIRFLMSRGADAGLTTNVVRLGRARVDEDGNPLPAPKPDRQRTGLGGQARGTTATVMGGMTALLIAARDGHRDAVHALVESGANINEVGAGDKSSPLVIAICNGHYDLAIYMLDHGANPNLATIDGLAALYAVEDTEYAQVGWGANPITAQEKTGYLDLTKALLEHGADPNARLSKALWFRPTSHNEEWVDKKGATPFWRAAQATDVAAMRILIAGGANPKIASEEGVTPLMVAAGLGWGANSSRTVSKGWLPAVKYCLELGADVNAHDIYNYTALHGAAYRGDNQLVQFLADKGAKLDIRSKRGQTATDMANGPMVNAHLPMRHPDTIALLEKLGASPPEAPAADAPKAARNTPTETKQE